MAAPNTSSPATHPAAETAPESRSAPRRPTASRGAAGRRRRARRRRRGSRWSRCAARACVTQACPRFQTRFRTSRRTEASARPRAGSPARAPRRTAPRRRRGSPARAGTRSAESPGRRRGRGHRRRARLRGVAVREGAARLMRRSTSKMPYSASSSSVTVSSRERYPAESRGRPADAQHAARCGVPSQRRRSGPRRATAGAPPRLAPPRAPPLDPAAGGPSADPADIRPGVTSPPSGARGGADWIVCLGNFSRRPSFSAPINEPMHFDRYVGQIQSSIGAPVGTLLPSKALGVSKMRHDETDDCPSRDRAKPSAPRTWRR